MDAVQKSSVGVDGELPVGRDEVVLEAEDQQGLVGLEVGLILGEDLQQRQHGGLAGKSNMRRVGVGLRGGFGGRSRSSAGGERGGGSVERRGQENGCRAARGDQARHEAGGSWGGKSHYQQAVVHFHDSGGC